MQAVLLVFALLGLHTAGNAESSGYDDRQAFEISQAAIGKTIGDYVLQDRTGKPVRLTDFRDKPLLVSFIYTGCFQSCPTDTLLVSRAVTAAQDLLGGEAFRVVSIGFNQPFDSPEAMAAFSKQRGISTRNWEFLSPAPADVKAMAADFGFTYFATPKGFDHVTQLTMVDRSGRVYRQLYGDNLNAPALLTALRDLDNGALPVAQGWSGVMTRIRLLCTVYDARSDTYRADYSVIVGLLVGASILGGVLWILIREWRRSRRPV